MTNRQRPGSGVSRNPHPAEPEQAAAPVRQDPGRFDLAAEWGLWPLRLNSRSGLLWDDRANEREQPCVVRPAPLTRAEIDTADRRRKEPNDEL